MELSHKITQDSFERWCCSCGEIFITKRQANAHVNSRAFWDSQEGSHLKERLRRERKNVPPSTWEKVRD